WTTWRKFERRYPGRVAVIDAGMDREGTGEALTAGALFFLGPGAEFRTGQRVAFQLPNSAEWMAFFLALQAKGLAAMPLDGGLPLDGCVDLALRLKARALFADGKWRSLDPSASMARAACLKVT